MNLSLKTIVQEFISGYDILELDKLDPNKSLYELGLIDSLSMHKLVSYIETNFDVKASFSDRILDYSLNDLLGLVKTKKKQ